MSALRSLSISRTLSLQDQGPADSPFTEQQACSSGGRGAWFLSLLISQKLVIGEEVHRIGVAGWGKKMSKKLGVLSLLEPRLET